MLHLSILKPVHTSEQQTKSILRITTHVCCSLFAFRDCCRRALVCFPEPSVAVVIHIAQQPGHSYLTQSLFQLKIVEAIRRSHYGIKVPGERVRWQLTQAHPRNNWYLVSPHTRPKQSIQSSATILVDVSVVVHPEHACDKRPMRSRSTPFLKHGRATPCSSMKGPVPFVTRR